MSKKTRIRILCTLPVKPRVKLLDPYLLDYLDDRDIYNILGPEERRELSGLHHDLIFDRHYKPSPADGRSKVCWIDAMQILKRRLRNRL